MEKEVFENSELQGLLRKIYKIRNNLKDSVEHVEKLAGMTKKEIVTFLDNPDNFTATQWKKIQRNRETVQNKLFSSLGKGEKAKQEIVKKKKLAKGRRGKTLGFRKGWLEMR